MKISHHIFVSVFFVCALKEMCSGYDPLDEPRGLLYRSMAHPERTRLRPEVKLRNILAGALLSILAECNFGRTFLHCYQIYCHYV